MAATAISEIDLNENASPVVVSSYSSKPALMKPKDGGATPERRKGNVIYNYFK